MKFTRELLGRGNQKGVALIVAIFTVMIITYLVMEIIYDTNVEYVVNSQSVTRLKAYYAAKSGLQLGLLRVKIFNKIVNGPLAESIPADKKKMLDMIWQFPFNWPPEIPAEASGVDKDLVAEKMKESKMDAKYTVTIMDEGSKIDVNDLGSPVKAIREITKKLLLQAFTNRRENDEEWAKRNDDLNFEEVIDNMIDWIDTDTTGISRGDERSLYENYKGEQKLPPNRAFRTVEELRMVAGMNEEIFSMLKDRVTVYGMRAINPNYAPTEVLKALDPSITDDVIAKVVERRNDQDEKQFSEAQEFWDFVNGAGARVSKETQESIPLNFKQIVNFRIRSTGNLANSTRQIEAVVFDFGSVAATVAEQLQSQQQQGNGQQQQQQTSNTGGTNGQQQKQGQNKTNKTNEPLPKGPPRIVYFTER